MSQQVTDIAGESAFRDILPDNRNMTSQAKYAPILHIGNVAMKFSRHPVIDTHLGAIFSPSLRLRT